MKYSRILENLDRKLGDRIQTRRYSLPEMISESYRAYYACDADTNIQKLVESHLEDVRDNPKDIERLSHQLGIVKEIVRMYESRELRDEDLMPKKPIRGSNSNRNTAINEKAEEDEEEKKDPNKDALEDTDLTDEEVEELTRYLSEIRQNKKVPVNESESYYEPSQSEIDTIILRCKKKGSSISEQEYMDIIEKVTGESDVATDKIDAAMEDANIHIEMKESLEKSVENDYKVYRVIMDVAFPASISPNTYGLYAGSRNNKLFSRLSDALSQQGLKMAGDIIDASEDITEIYKDNEYEFFTESLEKSVENEGDLVEKEDCDTVEPDTLDETLQNGKTDSREAVVLDTVFSYLRDQYSDEEFATLCKERFDMTDEELSAFCAIDESAKIVPAHDWNKVNLSEFNKKSSSKAFVKTFKKLDDKLHEGAALTRQEAISLYKAANSAMTHLSVELEHNPDFLTTFTEATTLLTSDVNKLLESMKHGKAPSKKTMKSLAKFSEALLKESATYRTEKIEGESQEELKESDDTNFKGWTISGSNGKYSAQKKLENGWHTVDGTSVEDVKNKILTKYKEFIGGLDDIDESAEEDEIPAIEDEELPDEEPEEKGAEETEEEATTEESDDFDQEYADARVELHKELVDEHGETEDPAVQEKIAQDAAELATLPGITDEQLAEIEGEAPTEEAPTEEAPTEEAPTEEAPTEGADDPDAPAEKDADSDELTIDDGDITDDEIEELKKHLKEMRSAR